MTIYSSSLGCLMEDTVKAKSTVGLTWEGIMVGNCGVGGQEGTGVEEAELVKGGVESSGRVIVIYSTGFI